MANTEITEVEYVEVPAVIDEDYHLARGNLKELALIGMKLAQDAAEVASTSQQSNSFIAAAQVIKSVIETNRELLQSAKVHKEVVGIQAPEKISTPGKVTNNLFVGSTAELAKMMKNNGSETE